MSVRKRAWKTTKGVDKEAWIVDYVDQVGNRHLKTFRRKKEADVFEATATVEIREGVHTADSASVTVAEAGKMWLATCEKNGLERSTTAAYRQHLNLHITPYLGRLRLSELSAPTIRKFEDTLRIGKQPEGGGPPRPRSQAMTRKILVSLGSLLGDAQERGLVSRNVVRDLRSKRHRGKERRGERRQKGKLKVGVDIPTREEIKAIVDHLEGRWRPILLTAIFTGLRASELRGLRWIDVDFAGRQIYVRQRADGYGAMGAPKSAAGERTVPLPPVVVNALREWKLACPKSQQDLVFPTSGGRVEHHTNIVSRGLIPTFVAAGVTITEKGANGDTVVRSKYTGLHTLRHFYASWCVNRRVDGGLELPPKVVQERLGHTSIMMTMDVYGHLFPQSDDGEELATAERALLA